MFDVPILYIIYNRPVETLASFNVLKQLRPARLYIAADGPRQGKENDDAATASVRDIVSGVDWPCKLKKMFSGENLGCRKGVEKALDWFFTEEQEGIILEDDIIPNMAFFKFCQDMLAKYRSDTSIFSVNGCSIGYTNAMESHGLTRYFNMWGWATWKRSYELVQGTWKEFNPQVSLEFDSDVKTSLHLPVLQHSNKQWLAHWQKQFTDTFYGDLDTWDFQWVYTSLKKNKYCIRPSQNYVMNIGFNENATHHKFTESPIRNLRYTDDAYTDRTDIVPHVDMKYEIFNVGNLVHSMHLETWKDKLAKLMPPQLKQWIKRNGLYSTIRTN